MNEFDPVLAIDHRASRHDREQAKIDKIGGKLAKYAVNQANKGNIGTQLVARTGRFLGRTSFINRTPEVYDRANQILADQGLAIEKTGERLYMSPSFPRPNDDVMTIRLTNVSSGQ